jgi:hypothetical protein
MYKCKKDDFISMTKIGDFLSGKEEEDKNKSTILWVLAVVGAVAAVAGIAYAVYRFFTPDYLQNFEADFEDDFEDDFFEDDFEDDLNDVK